MALYSPVQGEPNGNTIPDKMQTIAITVASPLSKWAELTILQLDQNR